MSWNGIIEVCEAISEAVAATLLGVVVGFSTAFVVIMFIVR